MNLQISTIASKAFTSEQGLVLALAELDERTKQAVSEMPDGTVTVQLDVVATLDRATVILRRIELVPTTAWSPA